MTIGVKYWDDGDSVPASFTDLEVVSLFMRNVWEIFDDDEALDGVKTAVKRKYLAVTIEPRNVHVSSVYTTVAAMLSADFVRFNDTRHTGTNTVTLVSSGAPQVSRDGQSEVLKRIVANYISQNPL